MDFKLVLGKLIKAFNDQGIRYGLIGGFALGVWGVGRATADIDFLVNRDDLENVNEIMRTIGYKVGFRSENVTHFISDEVKYGNVDFLHSFRQPSLEMLGRTEKKDVLGGEIIIMVVRPEDIIGLKVQAIANNPNRGKNDLADIESLISAQKDRLDWRLIEKYFKIFDMIDLFEKLRGAK